MYQTKIKIRKYSLETKRGYKVVLHNVDSHDLLKLYGKKKTERKCTRLFSVALWMVGLWVVPWPILFNEFFFFTTERKKYMLKRCNPPRRLLQNKNLKLLHAQAHAETQTYTQWVTKHSLSFWRFYGVLSLLTSHLLLNFNGQLRQFWDRLSVTDYDWNGSY